ncbi:MAG: hypothetical protein K2Y39_06900 [Candidatus Obscuribacterales bacterium]|nr:hypothetical protein [Candidatus Obscuribacterales bacterium]
MPSDYCLMHVGNWVTDLGAISCLGAGLAALVLTLLPGKKLTGKSEGVDPSSFIDPGAGETARYRLAYKDLVTVKNSGQDVTQVSGQAPQASAEGALEGTRAMSASELAITMFDQGVLGVGLGEKSLEATKSFSKTKVEKTRIDSKTKIDTKTKVEPKLDTKTKIEPKPKEDKPKPDKKAAKKDSKKGEEKKDLQLNMAVRKITYGSKKTDLDLTKPSANAEAKEADRDEIPDSLKPTYFSDDILEAMDRQPASFINQPVEPAAESETPGPSPSPMQAPSQGVPLPPRQMPAQGFPPQPSVPASFPIPPSPGFPAPAAQPPAHGFPLPGDNAPAPAFPAPTNPAQAFPLPASQPPPFPVQPQVPVPPQPTEPSAPQQIEEIDPKKDPKKVGRSTLIEPRSNVQKDREPPPPEYFK